MFLSFLICTLIYVGLWKWVKIPVYPVNYLSVIHASSSIVLYLMNFKELQLIQSISYFIIDIFQTDLWMWRFHHFFAIVCEGLVIYKDQELILLCSHFLYWSEIGGILYHMSRMFPTSKFVRCAFLLFYFASRIMLAYSASFIHYFCYHFSEPFIWKKLHVYSVSLIGNCLLAMNAWFLKKQFDIYKKDFISNK